MKRRLNNATALSGNGKVRSPARLLVPFRRSPSPRTRISVLMILTEPILRVGSDRYSRRWREQGNAPLQAEVEERGLSWRQEVLELATVPAPAWIAEWFAIETEEPVFLRRRRTWIEGVATQLADSYYLLADVEETRIRQEETGPGAVWLGSKRRDSTWNGSVRNLWPVCPPPMKPADCNWDLACRSSNCTGSRSPARGRSRCSAPSWSAPATSLPTTSRPASNSMQITFDSQPSPGQRTNEDLAMAGPRFAFVLDGTTAPPDVESGCVHHVTWLVSRLAGELARLRVRDESPMLPNTLAGAISQVRAQHANTCDLKNPASPSSTVALIRETRETIDYLVLADSPIVIRTLDGSVQPVHVNRTEYLPGYTPDIVREHSNVHGGFWVASTKPEAAYEAITGNFPTGTITTAGIFSDGTSRLAERHGWSWGQLLELLETSGPSQVIAQVHEADETVEAGTYRGKRLDDATALLCRFRSTSPGDCPKKGVSGSTRRPVGWRGRVADDRNTGGREPIEH